MQMIGTVIVYIIMGCLLLGAVGAVRDPDHGIGFEFLEGIRQLGTLFIPIAGLMASLPYMQALITAAFGGIADFMGHDPAIWAGILLPPDSGGNALAYALAAAPEVWIISLFTAFMVGSSMTFGIPLSISMVPSTHHRELAIGILCGLMACPVGITVSCAVCMYTRPAIRGAVSTILPLTEHLDLTWSVILLQLLPVYLICGGLALAFCLAPERTIRGFLLFGKGLTKVLYIIFALTAVEYFTGLCSQLCPFWKFAPIIADSADHNRALEVGGYCALMLGGAYPMMYLLQKYCARVIARLGRKLGLSAEGCLGVLASSVTLVAMLRSFERMPPLDRARCAALAVSSGYLLADHLVYCYNFQPQLYSCLFFGKLTGGFLAFALATLLTPKMLASEK